MMGRLTEKEKLDNLSLQGDVLHHALQSLAWINKWFGNHQAVCKTLLNICKKEARPLLIIDLGCGGGDLILTIAKMLRKHKMPCYITGIDGNNNSLAFARERCKGFDEIDFIQADILSKDFSMPVCDVLISSHFMYHFTDDELVHFLQQHSPNIASALIFSELQRNRMALFLFKISSFVLPISKAAKQDGLLAIKRSLTKKEWIDILQRASIGTFNLKSVPLFRILLVIFGTNKIQSCL